MTAAVYRHVDVDDMRAGLQRLSFEPSAEPGAQVIDLASGDSAPHGAPVAELRRAERRPPPGSGSPSESERFAEWVLQDSNLQPSGYEPPALPLS